MSPCLFNLYAEYILWHAGLDESQAGIKITRRNNNLWYTDDTTLTISWEICMQVKKYLLKLDLEQETGSK